MVTVVNINVYHHDLIRQYCHVTIIPSELLPSVMVTDNMAVVFPLCLSLVLQLLA